MTVDVVQPGTSIAYTATFRGQSFTIANNSGQYATITGLIVDGKAATEPGIGPNPERRVIGPLRIGDTFTLSADIGEILVEYDNGAAVQASNIVYCQPPNDGVTGWWAKVQAAANACHAAGGGTVVIAPSRANVPYVVDKTTVLHADTNVQGCGVGVTVGAIAAHFPLAQVVSRTESAPGSGIWSVGLGNIEQRAVFYVLPEAPFDASGMVQTVSNYRVPPSFSFMTLFGNKGQQDGPMSAVYAPRGKSDPEWARVAGAYGAPGYPTGTINLAADAGAYDGFQLDNFEAFSFSGTAYYAGTDRQRGKIGRNVRAIGCGTLDGGGAIVFDGGGYEILGNDWVVLPGAGFGGNTSPVKGSGQSGSLRSELNAWTQKGPNAYLAVQDINTNGASLATSVLNGAYRAQTAAGNANSRTGVAVVGVHFLIDDGLVTTGQPSGTIPSAPDDEHNASASYSGYRNVCDYASLRSTDKNGKSFKFLASATNSAGVRWSGIASSEANVQAYLANPFFSDATGSLGYDYYDPSTKVLHIGVHWRNALTGPNVADTQFVQIDSPLLADVVGRRDGAAPPAGRMGEPGASNGTITLVNNTAADVTTLVAQAPGEYDIYGEVQVAATTATAAAAGAYFEVSISTTANTLDSSSARLYAGQILPIPAGATNVPLIALRVGPIRVGLVANQTYHLVVKGNSLSTNAAISAAGVLHSRRW